MTTDVRRELLRAIAAFNCIAAMRSSCRPTSLDFAAERQLVEALDAYEDRYGFWSQPAVVVPGVRR